MRNQTYNSDPNGEPVLHSVVSSLISGLGYDLADVYLVEVRPAAETVYVYTYQRDDRGRAIVNQLGGHEVPALVPHVHHITKEQS